MATTQQNTTGLVERCEQLLATHFGAEIATLAQHYPDDRSLVIDYGKLFAADDDLALDALDDPEQIIRYLEEALPRVHHPVDLDLEGAHVRLSNVPETKTYYPGEFSPSAHHGRLRAIEGEVSKSTDDYARLEVAGFECLRCGTLTRIPQAMDAFQEPYECQGCERQGPFELNFEQSSMIDAQQLRVQTPAEEAQGDGQSIDAFVEDDYADLARPGDRVTVTGIVRFDQQGSGSNQANKFDPKVEGVHVELEETDARTIDISDEQREEIEALADGEKGDPIDLAADSLAPKIHGYDDVKRAIVLALVGGTRTEYAGGDFDRGEFHILLIGDPSTGKSKLVDRAEQVGWRSVGVSGKGATVAGVTASAVQDDFAGGAPSLEAGAAVRANRGVLAVDELDDMPEDVRAALLEPMSKQSIHMNKWGINTHLQTRVAVVAAANPEQGRFDPYEPLGEQFNLSATLLSRFDLIFTFRDVPDEDEDATIASHILGARDAAKRLERGMDLDDAGVDPRPAVDAELLRAWVALAKQQAKPVFADASVKERIEEAYTALRSVGDPQGGDPIPVTHRSLEGIVRVAEAAARFEFSDEITDRHVDVATELVGRSMRDIGQDPETGKFDADIVETGSSKSQDTRREALVATLKDLQGDGEVPIEDVVDELSEDWQAQYIKKDIQKLKDAGAVIEPEFGSGEVRYVGGWFE